jgi:hypothetical protein
MATMDCKQLMSQLDSILDGETRRDAQAHIAICNDCRGIIEDLKEITSVARTIEEATPDPPAYLWSAIRAQLEEEGVIRDTAAVADEAKAQRRGWRGWLGVLPRPALAGAYLAALIIAGFLLSGPVTKRMNDYRWRRGTQDSTAVLGAHLDSVEHTTVASLKANPVVYAALHKNLAIVDNYIALCEKTVREDPESEIARDYLYGAYQQKADLLAQMNERGD